MIERRFRVNRHRPRWVTPGVLVAVVWMAAALVGWPATAPAAEERCTVCHQEAPRFAPYHSPALVGCTGCHAGDRTADTLPAAHAGLEAYPGRVATAARSCGQNNCHPAQVRALEASIMRTQNGLIELAREGFGVADPTAGRGLPPDARLAEHGADSYLRKLCASCHLGNERGHHGQSLTDRGGGCAACHLQVFPQPPQIGGAPRPDAKQAPSGGRQVRKGVHPSLRLTVPNERCFGCHSRSARISLNYLGLAEVDDLDPSRPQDFGSLADGRLVERHTPDLHSEAGLSCTDCHTGTEVMGTGEPVARQRQQADVACEDCHAATLPEKSVAEMTRRELLYPGLSGWINPDFVQGSVVVTHRRGTPLWNLWREDGRRLLRKKVFGTVVAVPPAKAGLHHDRAGHERLTCSACHDTWAPQCDGCHIRFDPAGRQWDHARRAETPGRWLERRWHVRNEAPALGVTAEGQIAPFIPGMSRIAELPGREQPQRRVRYARTVPHTTRAKGRDCADCHRSQAALGVIRGEAVAPWNPALRLPIGWVARDAEAPAPALHAGDRSLNREERRRVRRVGECLACHPGASAIFADFTQARAAIAGQQPHPPPGTTRPAR